MFYKQKKVIRKKGDGVRQIRKHEVEKEKERETLR